MFVIFLFLLSNDFPDSFWDGGHHSGDTADTRDNAMKGGARVEQEPGVGVGAGW